MNYITEQPKKIPVRGEYDVVVAGGGFAGISAALSAARNGAKTLLIEKQFALGGLATLGLITIYLPLCDGCGRQVSFGIAEELFRLSILHGYEDGKENVEAWINGSDLEARKQHRFRVRFNAAMFAILAEQKLLETGVEILYGTSVCDTLVEEGSVKALFIESKSGREAVMAKSVVDATGDADVFALAKAQTRLFGQGNVLAAWYYTAEKGGIKLNPLGPSDIPEEERTKEHDKRLLSTRRYGGLDATEISEMTEASHDQVLKHFLAGGELSKERAIATIATIPQIRMTRSPVGLYQMDTADDHKHFDDSVGVISNWKKRGPIYEVPFRALYGRDLKNVIAAGRCISSTDAMWDVTRVIPVCAVTGEAAGCAAAISQNFETLNVEKLQTKLKDQGVLIHF